MSQNEDIPFDKRIFTEDKIGFEQAVKEIRTGDSYFYDGKDELVEEALIHYLKAQKFNPYSSVLNYKIGVCYLYSVDKLKSLSHFQFVEKVNPTIDSELPFYLGQSYQLWGQFEKAIMYYEQYKVYAEENDKKQLKYIDKKIEESKTGIDLMNYPVRVWVDNLGDSINSEYSEFSPVISADNKVLFYTARRPDSRGGKKDRTGKYYEDIYYSVREFEEDWHAGKNIGPPINTESHDATVGIAPDGKSIFTYQGISAKNGDILIARQLEDGTWEKPQLIGEGVNSKYHESSASISFDEQTLFFVSNKPGGYGQHDIYVTYWDKEKNEWGAAENLGPIINTEYEEKGVFYHADSKTLYFSSDGHKNMGGLDVFKTVYDEETGTWTEPENLGHPINTPDDDIYFVVTGNTRYAYYSSARPGGYGEKDIYKITFLGEAKKPAVVQLRNDQLAFQHPKTSLIALTKEKPKFLFSGQLIKGDHAEGIPGELYIVDTKTKKTVKVIQTDSDGDFSTLLDADKEYAVTASSAGFNFETKTLYTDLSFDSNVDLDFILYPPEVDIVNNDTSGNENTTTDNTVVENNTDNTENTDNSDNSTTDNSNTDNTGTTDNSDTNSDNTNTVVDNSNNNTDNTNTDNTTTDNTGTSDNTGDNNTNTDNNNNGSNENSGNSFTMKNLYFGFDESTLDHIAFNSVPQVELDLLVKMMKSNPTMKIELGGHADQRGPESYNKVLSLKRAEIVKQYLVNKGIDASRIKTVGYGESSPEVPMSVINEIENRTERERAYQKNRRTVVTILSN